ncbi:MAG: hypothetical protein GC168_20895 [Candidatus Hydrogenedens sp.]|nr:hypothetical protein [Candidatus Hydrogenedens sp.]
MLVKRIIPLLILCAALGAAAQPVPITGAGNVSIAELEGTSTLVTVVLKQEGAQDKNLRVLSRNKTTINFLNAENEIIPYLYSSIDHIEVQGGKLESTRFELSDSRALRPEQQIIHDRALSRAKEIFDNSAKDQEVRIRAATLLTLRGEDYAETYLKELSESNSITAQLKAATALWLAGKEFDVSLLRKGFDSGNLNARAQAAQLAGLSGKTEFTSDLLRLVQDRSAAQAGPAARALARLGNREVIPQLLSMIEQRNEEKGEAACWSLAELGGDDVIEQLKIQLEKAEGFGRHRIVRVLYDLDDEVGKRELKRTFREVYSLSLDAALLLAADGDFEALGDLQNRLNQRYNEDEEGLTRVGKIATALMLGGDSTAQAVYQQIFRKDSMPAKISALRAMVEVGDRRLMNLVQSALESGDISLAVEACTSAIALSDPGFRQRLLAFRKG